MSTATPCSPTRFVLSQVSSWDYFQPNTSGQAVLAQQSSANGFNW
jgi:hypothetical protein